MPRCLRINFAFFDYLLCTQAFRSYANQIRKEARDARRQRRREILHALAADLVENNSSLSSGELYDLLIKEGFAPPAQEPAGVLLSKPVPVVESTSSGGSGEGTAHPTEDSAGSKDEGSCAAQITEKPSSKRQMIYDALQRQVTTLFAEGANPKHVIERLMDRVTTLTKELSKYHINDEEATGSLQERAINTEDSLTANTFISPWDHFEANAIGTGFPEFLYAPGFIRNTRMPRIEARREVLLLFEHQERLMAAEQERRHNDLLIRLEWERENKSDLAIEAQKKMLELEMSATPFVSFGATLEEYLMTKYPGNFNEAVEFTLNLILAGQQSMDDSVCRLFILILKDQLSFETRLHQTAQLEDILTLCKQTAFDPREGKEWITIEAFVHNIRRICPQKGDISIVKLEKYILAAPRRKIAVSESRGKNSESDLRQQLINFKDLLYEPGSETNNNGNAEISENKFVELFRNQHTDESILFAEHIDACISKRCSDRVQPKDMPDDPDIFYAYVHRIREAMEAADPSKSRDEVNVYLARGCGLSIEDMLLHEGKRIPIDLVMFRKRLRHGLLFESVHEDASKLRLNQGNFRVNSTIISNSKIGSSSVMFPSMSSLGFMSAAKFTTVSRAQL